MGMGEQEKGCGERPKRRTGQGDSLLRRRKVSGAKPSADRETGK